jgi:hypothetical protein
MQTRFSLILLGAQDSGEVIGYPEGATADVLAEIELVAPHVREFFLAGGTQGIRVLGLIAANAKVVVVKREQARVFCQLGARTFTTVISVFTD